MGVVGRFSMALALLLLATTTIATVPSSIIDFDNAAAANDDDDETSFRQWTCDQLTPDLCPDLTVVESGKVPIRDGVFVQYWKYGSNTTKSSSGIPIIVAHGGPGMTHNYMIPLKQQACRSAGRPVYMYDQAGCGASTLPPNITNVTMDLPFLLDMDYYATEELPKLITYWDLKRYHLLGNSCGSMLAQYFALQKERPKGLVSMVLSGPLSDGDLYIKSQWDPDVGNLGSLPPFVQDRLSDLGRQEAYDSAEYQAIASALSTFFTIRTTPAPDCWEAAENGTNQEIYVGMQGPSEFSFGGTLAHFNKTPELPTLEVPILLTSGQFDTMRPPVVDAMYQTIPNVEWTMFQHSGHVSMIDDAGTMNNVVDDFLNRVEEAYRTGTEFVPRKDACGVPGCRSKYDDEEVDQVGPIIQATQTPATVTSLSSNRIFHFMLVSIASGVVGALLATVVLRCLPMARATKTGYQLV